jgi:hypothetical protein
MIERTIFLGALDREDLAERAAYLNAACAARPGLRRRIEELLRSHREAGAFLDVPAQEQLAAAGQSQAFLALFICTQVISTAVFLILEMDQPFEGTMQIPRAPLRNALAQPGK